VIITKLQVAPVELDVSSESSQVEFEPYYVYTSSSTKHILSTFSVTLLNVDRT